MDDNNSFQKLYNAVFIGAGASGFFAAITTAQKIGSGKSLCLIEQYRQPLTKLKVSGGGRCNVTHACFDPDELIKHYPRGQKALLSPFSRFHSQHMIEWLKEQGVDVKAEQDGRMFPTTDSSQTIIDCFQHLAKNSKLNIKYQLAVEKIHFQDNIFTIHTKSGQIIQTTQLYLATGSNRKGLELAKSLGHTIVPLVPSLFTFNVPTSPFLDLSGLSVDQATVSLPEFKQKQTGPVLITHWGFSGPAIIKLSSWCARELYQRNYKTECVIDWIPNLNIEKTRVVLSEQKTKYPNINVRLKPMFNLPKKLWSRLLFIIDVDEKLTWGQISKKQMNRLLDILKFTRCHIDGKTTYKKEFVTCGGIALDEVNFKNMESRICKGLYFGGEILDIDGVTGGFNFQAAWSTAWVAATSIAKNICSV